jgi:hypothetical protein
MENIIQNINEWLVVINGLIVAIIAVCMLIPGDQPEKTLQKIVDILSKFSKK